MKSIREREWFFSQEKIPFEVSCSDPHFNVYRLATTGQVIVDIDIPADLGGEEVTVGVTADLHLNFCNMQDRDDAELAYTEQCRIWQRDQKALPAAISALYAADFCDVSVNVGDTIDYQSQGAIDLTKRHLIAKYPEIIMTPGAHDFLKQMQTKLPEQLPLEQRLDKLRAIWPHDLHYYSRVIKDKVMCVALDNSQSKYLACQYDKLLEDIGRCRAEGLVMLIFSHEPINPAYPCGKTVEANIKNSGARSSVSFPEISNLAGCEGFSDEVTMRIYRLITSSADVVRAYVAGHWHSQFYLEISATRPTDNGEEQTVIPQYVISGNPYHEAGCIARITVH